MRARDCGELPARRSSAMADEARRYPCLWRRDLDRCLFRLPPPFLSQYASLYAARNRAHANLLLRDIAGNELHHSMPGVARAAASGPAFLHHVSHPPHALSLLLPFLSAKCAARRRNSAADHRLRASHADLCGTADAKTARPLDTTGGGRGHRRSERTARHSDGELGTHEALRHSIPQWWDEFFRSCRAEFCRESRHNTRDTPTIARRDPRSQQDLGLLLNAFA